MAITPDEVTRLIQKQQEVDKTLEAYGTYKSYLAKRCDHPADFRDEWKHHYSNGFGSWRTDVMPYCKLCGLVQYNAAYGGRWDKIPVNNYED